MTCAGGSSAIDMMLEWIRQLLGHEIAVTVADLLVHSVSPSSPSEVRIPAAARYGTTDARVLSCIALMEEQLEDPATSRSWRFGPGFRCGSWKDYLLQH